MKLERIGNPKGIDIDYKVTADSFEEIKELHESLLKKGLLFLYRRGALPFEEFNTFTVLHYVDKNLKIHDYGISFPKSKEDQPVKDELNKKLDKVYEDARKDTNLKSRLRIFMTHYMRLMAFAKHMKAYNKETLTGEYKKRFDKEISFIKKDVIEVDNIEPTIQNMETIVTNIFDILLPEYS
jgi:hypothetical protein